MEEGRGFPHSASEQSVNEFLWKCLMPWRRGLNEKIKTGVVTNASVAIHANFFALIKARSSFLLP